MLRSVLIIDAGEVFSTAMPGRLQQALFPGYNDRDIGNIPCENWLKILESLSPLDQPLTFRLTVESEMDVLPKLASPEPQEGDMLCLVKTKTLRKSDAGTVQIHQLGRLSGYSHEVTLLNEFVVVKGFDVESLATTRRNPLEELMLHQKLVNARAPGVIPLLGCLASRTKVYALFPYAPDGDMFSFLSRCPGPLSENQIRRILHQMTCSVMSCHANYICHRDISLENFLRVGEKLALIDFGLSVQMDPASLRIINHGQVGKHKYMAPELVAGTPLEIDGRKLDVWSLGVTLFMLMTLTEPFHIAGPSDSRYRTIVLRKKLRETMHGWGFDPSPSLLNLLEAMLCSEPSLRPTAEDILAHPWMNEAV